MKEEIIRIKNDIGVEKEYSVLSYYQWEGKEYRIYTDFVPNTEQTLIKLYVDEKVEEDKYQRVSEEEQEKVLQNYLNELPKEAEKVFEEIVKNMGVEQKQPSQESNKDTPSKIPALENRLQRMIQRNDPKKITAARGRLIKEIKKEIKQETNEQRKKSLQEKLTREIKNHKTQLDERYKKEYQNVKKDFKSLFTALPAGLSIATKKIIATINDLKASKTGKKSILEKISAMKEIIQAMGTPIDYLVRFGINHWYLLLLLLGSSLIKWKPEEKKDDKGKIPQPELSPELSDEGVRIEEQEKIINPTAVEESTPRVAVTPSKTISVEVDPNSMSASQQKQEQIEIRKMINSNPSTEVTVNQLQPQFNSHEETQPVAPANQAPKSDGMEFFADAGESYEPGGFDIPPKSVGAPEFNYDYNLSYEENRNIFISMFGGTMAFLFGLLFPQSMIPTAPGINFFTTQPISPDGMKNSL